MTQSWPIEAARKALDGTALARDQDLLTKRMVFGHYHQSKGLTDHVFVPGMVDGKFPPWRAIEDDDTEEDRRVFYVAVTRARRASPDALQQDARGQCRSSRFLEGLIG